VNTFFHPDELRLSEEIADVALVVADVSAGRTLIRTRPR